MEQKSLVGLLILILSASLALPASAGAADLADEYYWRDPDYQLTQTASEGCRHRPAPGYTTSSTYYRFVPGHLSSTYMNDSTWRSKVATAESEWDSADTMFHFYPASDTDFDSLDHSIRFFAGYWYPGALAVNYVYLGSDNYSRPIVTNWYIRINPDPPSSSYPSARWVSNAATNPSHWDSESIIQHELGHSIHLWHAGEWRGDADTVTMYGGGLIGPGDYWMRTLEIGDFNGVSRLY